jgi:hypothetical protein
MKPEYAEPHDGLCKTVGFQDPAGPTAAVTQHPQHHVLGAQVAVPEPFGLRPSQVQNPLGVLAALGHRCYLWKPNRRPAYLWCTACLVTPTVPRIGPQPLAGLLLSDLPLPADGQTDQPACRGDRFPCSTQAPEPRSRHLHAGHHLASRQAPARLVPEQLLDPGFDVIQAVSTPHQWFASARLRDPHLTRSRRAVSATLTTPALDRRNLRWFATSPCRAATGGPPPSLMPHRSRAVSAPSKPSFTFMAHKVASHHPGGLLTQERSPGRGCPSWRRVVRIAVAETRTPSRSSSPLMRW